ncbi:hypothetical protein M9H77_23140 [Catharanthus roseus]|uniref:Uncharacterized protein n=1 Tax=Catharanthus roseus TaxID=4058 RepID=A0ACC0ATP0_CATRO|nr:hypothetical protein M9H77_23140 [Catharanthus roseus]
MVISRTSFRMLKPCDIGWMLKRWQSEPWKNDGGQRPRDQLARGGVANVPGTTNAQNQIGGYNSSDEEEDLILAEDQNRPARRGGGKYNNNYNIQQNNDHDGGDFRLKVDIPSFYDIPQEKRVKLVACRLKGAAFAWWERLLHKRQREGYKEYEGGEKLSDKAELMIRDRGRSRFEGNRRTYGNDNFQMSNSGKDTSRSFTDRTKATQGCNQGTERKEDKGLVGIFITKS